MARSCQNCGNCRAFPFYQMCGLGFADKFFIEGVCGRWTSETASGTRKAGCKALGGAEGAIPLSIRSCLAAPF